jgi:hypothetical protein
VLNLPPPQFFAPQKLGGVFQVQLQGVPNRKHVFESTTNLTPPILWSPVGTNVLNGAGTGTYSENIGANARKFFRAREME